MKLPVGSPWPQGTGPVFADPPAHGYYKKHRDDHRTHYPKAGHYEGKNWAVYVRDYGIVDGRCNRDEIGAVIGGVTGAVIGGQVANREDRAAMCAMAAATPRWRSMAAPARRARLSFRAWRMGFPPQLIPLHPMASDAKPVRMPALRPGLLHVRSQERYLSARAAAPAH